MKQYKEMTREQLSQLSAELADQFAQAKAQGLQLDMSRGKPDAQQLALSMPLLDIVNSKSSLLAEDGTNCGNYGGFDGIPEVKRLMAEMMELEPAQVFMGGVSSLNLMHDLMTYCTLYPLPGCDQSWKEQGEIKFLCPSPGYDRHFAVSQHLGCTLVTVPMTDGGPDMDVVEQLVANDAAIKGIWCVPKYSNPTGVTYSADTVERLASMKTAAPDFRIFWDNAYSIHDLYQGEEAVLASLMAALERHGNPDRAFLFASLSKVTFSGGSIAAVGASRSNIAYIKAQMENQMITFDKINQLRHARYFKDLAGLKAHMKLHAEIVRPKFEAVLSILDKELSGLGIAAWTKPLGGYFISLDTMDGCAKRAVALCKEAGVAMTPAGYTFPYELDPRDSNVRIAPTFPSKEDLEKAANLLCLCVKMATVEQLLQA